jgi:hypothetical protein
VVVLLFAAALVVAVSPPARQRLGYKLPLGLESVFPRDSRTGALQLRLPGLDQPLYAPDDPWRLWLAGERTCPGGEDGSAPWRAQARVQLCLLNFARAREGLQPVRISRVLTGAAASKAADIAQCREFEHQACGRPFDAAARELAYRGAIGENLYISEGRFTVPRVAVDQWLNSDGHRENLFRPEWRTVGIALLRDVDAPPVRDGVVWVNVFGE